MPEVCKMSVPGKSKLKKVSLTAGRIVGLLVGIVLTGYYANGFLNGWWRDKRPEWYIGIEDIVFYGVFALSAILWLGGAYWRFRAKKRIRSPAPSGFRRPVSLPVRTLTSILKLSGVILGSALFFPVSCTTALLAGIEINSHHFGRDMLRGDKPRPPFYVIATLSKEDIRPIELIEVDAYIGRTPDVSFLIAQRSGALPGDSPDERFSWRVTSSNSNEQLVEVRYYDGDTTFISRYRAMRHSVSPVSQRKWYHGYMFASFPFAIGFGLLIYGLGRYLRRKYVVTISERTNMRKWVTALVILCILGIAAPYISSYVAYRKSPIRQEQAILDFNKALEENPKDAEAYLKRGIAQAEKGRYKQAISDYNKAIEINPRNAKAYINRGYAYVKDWEYDQAVSDFNKAIEIDPGDADAYINRGNVYAKKGRCEQAVTDDRNHAISDYTKALELNPRCAKAYLHRGNAYKDEGKYDQAISDFNEAIEIDPRDASAYNNRGVVYGKMGQYDQAISDYTRALEISPMDADVYINRGLAYAEKGQYDQEVSDYTKALQINPREGTFYILRAYTYYFQKDYEKSWKDVEKAEYLGHRIDPEFLDDLRKASGRKN
jgi:tetratricopeptide (TPR) repeat protein